MLNKLRQSFLFILLLAGIFFSGCSKDNNNNASLRITLIDQGHNLISGGLVTLKTFDHSLTDSNGNTGGASTGEYYGVTGSDGNVFFENLNPGYCFWVAKKDCMTNFLTPYGSFPTLESNFLTTDTSRLFPEGTLTFKNNTIIECEVFIDSCWINNFVLEANKTISIPVVSGQYTVGWKNSNSPTRTNALFHVNCTDTTMINLPF